MAYNINNIRISCGCFAGSESLYTDPSPKTGGRKTIPTAEEQRKSSGIRCLLDTGRRQLGKHLRSSNRKDAGRTGMAFHQMLHGSEFRCENGNLRSRQ